MEGKRFEFMGLPLDALTMEETLQWIERAIRERQEPRQHTVINAAKVVLAAKEPFLRQSIIESHLVNADGQAIVWGGKLLGIPVPERVTGVDLMNALFQRASEKGFRVFLLGATQEVLSECLKKLRECYPSLVIAGSRNGYFSDSEAEQVAMMIRDSKADILFAAMPTPKKERFIHNYLSPMGVPFAMGVGGSFDVLAGKVRRAPAWMQKAGMEWFYRFIQEPRRLFKRYAVTNSVFIRMLGREWLHQKLGGRSSRERSLK